MAEKEPKLQAAITSVKDGKKTAAAAIRDFNIPRKTFYRRVAGIPPRNKAHENDQHLTHAEEKELVCKMDNTSYRSRISSSICDSSTNGRIYSVASRFIS